MLNQVMQTLRTALSNSREALAKLPNFSNISRSELRAFGLTSANADEAEDAIASIRYYRQMLDAEYARLERALENK